MSAYHVGRSWTGCEIENACPCPQEKCGLIAEDKIDPTCPEHSTTAARTIRRSHTTAHCSAVPGRT